MKKHLSIPVLVLAAGLAGSFQPGSGYAREQSSPGPGSGQPARPDSPRDMGAAPQGGVGTGWEERDRLRQKDERLGVEPGARQEQEQLGVAPETGEEPPEQLGSEPEKGLEQDQLGTGSGEGLEQEELGVAPEAREGTPGQQERFGAEPEQAGQEQFGIAPGFGEKSGEGRGWVGPESERRGTGWRRKTMPEGGR